MLYTNGRRHHRITESNQPSRTIAIGEKWYWGDLIGRSYNVMYADWIQYVYSSARYFRPYGQSTPNGTVAAGATHNGDGGSYLSLDGHVELLPYALQKDTARWVNPKY